MVGASGIVEHLCVFNGHLHQLRPNSQSYFVIPFGYVPIIVLLQVAEAGSSDSLYGVEHPLYIRRIVLPHGLELQHTPYLGTKAVRNLCVCV
jgi:hypothetical protein